MLLRLFLHLSPYFSHISLPSDETRMLSYPLLELDVPMPSLLSLIKIIIDFLKTDFNAKIMFGYQQSIYKYACVFEFVKLSVILPNSSFFNLEQFIMRT